MNGDIKFHFFIFVLKKKQENLRKTSKNFYKKNISRKLEIYFPNNNIALRFS